MELHNDLFFLRKADRKQRECESQAKSPAGFPRHPLISQPICTGPQHKFFNTTEAALDPRGTQSRAQDGTQETLHGTCSSAVKGLGPAGSFLASRFKE